MYVTDVDREYLQAVESSRGQGREGSVKADQVKDQNTSERTETSTQTKSISEQTKCSSDTSAQEMKVTDMKAPCVEESEYYSDEDCPPIDAALVRNNQYAVFQHY